MRPRQTSDEIARAFERDGYVTGLPALNQTEVAHVRSHIESFRNERPEDAAWAFDIKSNLLFNWVYDLCCHRALVNAAISITGPDVFVTNATFRIKQPGSSQAYGWHQDSARIQVEPCFIIVFLALSEQTKDNGCLQVIPGSHKQVHPFHTVDNPDGQEKRIVARTENVDAHQAVALELDPGEICLFSGNLVHGSGPNDSNTERVSLLIDYTPTHARQHHGQGSGQLVNGADRHGYIASETVPVGNCLDIDVINRRKALQTWPENPLMGPLGKDGVISFPDSSTIGY